MKYFNLILLFAITLTACGGKKTEPEVQEIRVAPGSAADIIRNPVTSNQPLDTSNVAKIQFNETSFDFGSVEEGKVVEHIFLFKNVGKVPLLINDARSTCGCTVPTYPKEAILPGAMGKIEVKFDTKNKIDRQNKPVTVTANTFPSETKVELNGTVTKK